MRFWRVIRLILLVLLGSLVLIQLVPIGRDHTNPPVSAEPDWDSPETRALAAGACFDCHSNETEWPWYTNVAPVSWLVENDVEEGRETLNFSEWDRPQGEADEVAEAISEGEMPPWYYAILHSDARLSVQEEQQLIAGLRATFQRSPPLGGGD